MSITRCGWVNLNDTLYVHYHDTEWGVPLRGNDHALFERITLEGAQAGLSWITILRKREQYRAAFDGFDPAVVARYDDAKAAALLANPGIVRNRAKIAATINNARCFLDVQSEFGSFDAYLWRYVDGVPLQNQWHSLSEIPAETDLSRAMSKDLRTRGFKFVGATICYAMMQAIGMVNDHTVDCYRHSEVRDIGKQEPSP
ncbi:MAG: DNA-3-methyladenine glycosylase I [Chloroflexota bacterium]|nr:DNA-3-methyladenine glycosylase I [Chloroflexota bacterium]